MCKPSYNTLRVGLIPGAEAEACGILHVPEPCGREAADPEGDARTPRGSGSIPFRIPTRAARHLRYPKSVTRNTLTSGTDSARDSEHFEG